MRWLLARTPPLLALGVVLLATGCGQLSPGPSSTADDQPSVLGPPSPGSSSVDVAPTGTVDIVDPEDTASKPLGMSAFEDAMATYCTDYFTSQRDNEEQNHWPNEESRLAFARQSAADARRTERRLASLVPPTKLATAFGQFVDSTHRISEDRAAILASVRAIGQDGRLGSDVGDVLTERRSLATQLHAPLCDGKLPPGQELAAVAAARTWATTPDPVEACRELVTPTYYFSPEAEASCEHTRTLENTPPYQLPDDIAVVEVTGVESLIATVSYLKVGGCGCDPTGILRLFFLDGEWRVNQSADLRSSSSIVVDN